MEIKTLIEPELSPGHDIDLLLVGKTGPGKTATGNFILGRDMFKPLSEERTYQLGYREVDGRVIKVVDVLGYDQSDCSCDEKTAEHFVYALSKGLGQFTRGFSAVLLVISNVTLTDEEEKSFKAMKEILGEDVLKTHGICVVSGGYDMFNNEEKENSEVNFQSWCRNQTGILLDLFEECEFRCIPIDKGNEDPLLKKSQLVELTALVDSIKERHILYTYENFLASKEDDEDNSEECNCRLPIILENVSRENYLIQEAVHKMMHSQNEDRLEVYESLRIKDRADKLLKEIEKPENEDLKELKMDTKILVEEIVDYDDRKIYGGDENEEEKEKLRKIMEKSKSINVKIRKMKSEQDDYYKWITMTVGPSVETLMSAIVPTVVEGALEAAEFVLDVIFD